MAQTQSTVNPPQPLPNVNDWYLYIHQTVKSIRR